MLIHNFVNIFIELINILITNFYTKIILEWFAKSNFIGKKK